MMGEAGIAVLIVALVSLLKTAGLQSRYLPVAALLLGLLAGLAFHVLEGLPAFSYGLGYGLLACGLYSSIKAMAGR